MKPFTTRMNLVEAFNDVNPQRLKSEAEPDFTLSCNAPRTPAMMAAKQTNPA